jgi:hypothetical protein
VLLAEQQERIDKVQKVPVGNIRIQAAPGLIKAFVGAVVDALRAGNYEVIDVSNEKMPRSDESVRSVYIVARVPGEEGDHAVCDD